MEDSGDKDDDGMVPVHAKQGAPMKEWDSLGLWWAKEDSQCQKSWACETGWNFATQVTVYWYDLIGLPDLKYYTACMDQILPSCFKIISFSYLISFQGSLFGWQATGRNWEENWARRACSAKENPQCESRHLVLLSGGRIWQEAMEVSFNIFLLVLNTRS